MSGRCSSISIIKLGVLSVYLYTIYSACPVLAQRHSFQILQENDVTIALNTGGPRFRRNLFSFDRLLITEQNPSMEESVLFRPWKVAIGEEKRIYVIDIGDMRVAVFDSLGHFSHSFGRRGDGPGEFRDMEIQEITGDTLSIYDKNLLRTSRFLSNGELIDILTSSQPNATITGVFRLDNGCQLVKHAFKEREGNFDLTSAGFVILDAKHDTLAIQKTLPAETWYTERTALPGGGRQMRGVFVAYVAKPTTIIDRNRGILLTSGKEPELQWFDFSGVERYRIQLDLPVNRITPGIQRTFIRWNEERRKEQIVISEGAGAGGSRLQPRFPEICGYWNYVMVDDSGFIWLRDVWGNRIGSRNDGYTFFIISPEGEYLGKTELPVSEGYISQGYLIGIEVNQGSGERIPTVWQISSNIRDLKYP